ncbi:hypothetical protein M8C21_009832, partial [Ambrosia artemisiifolia]
DKADKSWFQRNAESIERIVDENDSEDDRANKIRKKKASSAQLKKLKLQPFVVFLQSRLYIPPRIKNHVIELKTNASMFYSHSMAMELLEQKEKDPLKPKGPYSAYFLFMNQRRVALIAENKSVVEIAKVTGEE